MAAPAGTVSVAAGALMWLLLIGMGAEPSGRVGTLRGEVLSDDVLFEEDESSMVPDPAVSLVDDTELAEAVGDDVPDDTACEATAEPVVNTASSAASSEPVLVLGTLFAGTDDVTDTRDMLLL